MSTEDKLLEYLQYWGLDRAPFSLAPDPKSLFLSRQHFECLLRLKYAVLAGKGGALLVSKNAGDGKTTILRRLCNDLREELKGQVRIAFVDHPTLSPVEMLQEISRQIGIERPFKTKARALSALRERLMELRGQGQKCVVIIDEGQMLEQRPKLLQELRILLNLYSRDDFLLSFILSGQHALEALIRETPEFWQRLPVRFFLGNLDPAETRKLIQHRLRCAGLEPGAEIFTPEAYERIHAYSEGCPRVICSIADLALLVGRGAGVRRVDAPQVVQAHADNEGPTSDGYHYYHFLRSAQDPAEPRAPLPPTPAPPRARCDTHGVPTEEPDTLRVIPVEDRDRGVNRRLSPSDESSSASTWRTPRWAVLTSSIWRGRPSRRTRPARWSWRRGP
ncbi:MAG: AAA family ATPase [Deltaproteobacteria bacterium]|nr:AAA family ATPase [Deltaproteobacteria bacterium]MBW2413697.1 AAA family ATPase [Deltaproteobacteria bacterium]